LCRVARAALPGAPGHGTGQDVPGSATAGLEGRDRRRKAHMERCWAVTRRVSPDSAPEAAANTE
jgi:hypothetical protein